LPVREAILVNLFVGSLAALMLVVRQRKMLDTHVPAGKAEWLFIVIPAIFGGIAGRILAVSVSPKLLLGLLGGYAILVGLRIFIIKPLPEKETKEHVAWLAPVGFASGLLAGLISAGGKPFAVPAYNNALGHHPQRAYAFASLGVVVAVWSALATQVAVSAVPSLNEVLMALYEFILVTLTALVVQRIWSVKLNKIVNLTIAPILILVGIKFLFQAIH
jgi:uncharacterized membrane protein YfcA